MFGVRFMARHIRGILIGCTAAALLLALALHFNRTRVPSTASVPANQSTPAPTSKPSWPVWGGALNSAEFSGTNFFSRDTARRFAAEVGSDDARYVIELNSRALLPRPDAELNEIFDAQNAETRTVYLQFKENLTDAQRETLRQ